MTARTRSIRLGIFIVLSAAVIGLLLALFLGIGVTRGTRYWVHTDDAEGLDVSVPVKLRGVRVGRVTALELASNGKLGVRVELEVEREARIPAGARAYFEFAGVSGLKMVNIRGGDAKAPALPAGSEIPVGETTLDKLGDQGEELLARAGKALENADRLITGLERSTSRIDPERIDRTVKDAQQAMSELNRLVRDSRAPVRRSLSSAESALARVDGAVERSDQAVSNLNATIAELRGVVRENGGEVRTTLDNLRDASKSFKTLSQELRRRPNRLLFGGSAPERELP
jgi:phospholipid/cholesterol/gamma-HCH transport system substrate-binding protein